VSQPLSISSAAINFTRKPSADKPAGEAPPRRRFFTWLNPSAAADADIAQLLNRDVEKRRRNAWLRQIGFVGRIAMYACLLGALFIFRPEGASDVTTKPIAQLAIGDIMAAVVWVIIGLLLLRALFKPNPRPDYQEAWGLLSVVLIIGALVLGALFLYLRAFTRSHHIAPHEPEAVHPCRYCGPAAGRFAAVAHARLAARCYYDARWIAEDVSAT
jgi:hypothetical protein